MPWPTLPLSGVRLTAVFAAAANAALIERENALTQYQATAIPVPYSPSPDQVTGDHIDDTMGEIPFHSGLRTIQSRLNFISFFFVQNKYDVGGADVSYSNRPFDSKISAFQPFVTWSNPVDALGNDISFPPPNGFRRKYPAEITSLSTDILKNGMPSDIGDVALYLGNFPFAVDPNFGKLFVKTGSATWAPAAPGSTKTIKQAYGLIQSGDYIGDWIAEDIYNALNLLVWTWGVVLPSGILGYDHPAYGGVVNVRFANNQDNSVGSEHDGSGNPIPYFTQFTSGMRVQDRNEIPYGAYLDALFPVAYVSDLEGYDPTDYPDNPWGHTSAFRIRGQYRVEERNAVGLSNLVEYYGWSILGGSDAGGPATWPGFAHFKPGPVPTANTIYKITEAANGGSSDFINSPAITTFPGLSEPPTNSSWGWRLYPSAIVKYDVAGGFSYVA